MTIRNRMPKTRELAVGIVALLLLIFAWPHVTPAVTAKEQYVIADGCYRKLLKNGKKQKYRDNWLRCIQKFEAVYRNDPTGPWAAAGLYMTGRLYRELHGHSYLSSDRKEALDIFERVVKRFPKSRYRARAAKAIGEISGGGRQPGPKIARKTASVRRKTDSNKTDAAKKQYLAADLCHQRLLENKKLQKYRDRWLRCIDTFEAAYGTEPDGPWAAAASFRAGELYEALHGKSYKKSDKLAAFDRYDRVLNRFPDSAYASRARAALGKPAVVGKPVEETSVAAKAPERPPVRQPAPPADKEDDIAEVIGKSYGATDPAGDTQLASPGNMATIRGLRHWSNPSYTRVVIDADREARYTHRLLKKDPSIHKPQRLYVDLAYCRLGSGIPKTIPINDNLLSDARAGQHSKDHVRVVVDIKSFKTYKIFSLRNPFRIVIDVWGGSRMKPESPVATGAAQPKDRLTADNLAKQLALGVSRIVIDPGHGGKDFGAPGYLKGVHEKHIVLKIAKRLALKIRKTLGCEVIMTREGDRYLTLEERTAIANTQNADLFISIHTNSARSRKAYGIETFFLNLATDDDAILVAARENATSKKNISDLQTILSDLMQNAKINESSRLAGIVQRHLYGHMKKRYSRIKSKGVKQAPFYVLLGAQMPAILVETSFISNPRECKRLKSQAYQDHLCEGIIEGIREYIREINPSARWVAPAGNSPTG